VAKGIGYKGGGPNLARGKDQPVLEAKGKFIHMAFKNESTFVCMGPALFKEFTINGGNITSQTGKFGQND
jgi:hypothetical protein